MVNCKIYAQAHTQTNTPTHTQTHLHTVHFEMSSVTNEQLNDRTTQTLLIVCFQTIVVLWFFYIKIYITINICTKNVQKG